MDHQSKQSVWNPKDVLIQSIFLVVLVLIIATAIQTTRANLEALNLTSGFSFLDRTIGWSYSFALVDVSIDDTYRKTLLIGFFNTLFLGLISIVIATLLGFAVGAGADARNIAVAGTSVGIIQIFRNIPLILQAIFWYAFLIHMPGPRQAFSFFDLAFFSNRGAFLPTLNISLFYGLLLMALIAAVWIGVWRIFKASNLQRTGIAFAISFFLCLLFAIAFTSPDDPFLSIPELKGLRFRGGFTVPIEFVAMLVAIVLYGSAYIAEVVKGGLRAVPKGLIEAGRSVGLSETAIWLKIKMPMALRSIIPPLGNQWIFLMKATTVGIAIGFSDLFMIVSTSINQSGQTLEFIFILMASFLLINFLLARFISWLNNRVQLVTN